jgi:hypothetical protein
MINSTRAFVRLQNNLSFGWLAILLFAPILGAAHDKKPVGSWQLGAPIVTYWAGPNITDTVAEQMKAGGFNLVWCRESELDIAARHGLRALVWGGPLSPNSLDTPQQQQELDAFIDRVRHHPAVYSYFLIDEPSSSLFPQLGKVVAYLRQQDPAHLVYINLFPTYANNEQLGNKGEVVSAYREHLRQYVDKVKPALISYDHYQFAVGKDGEEYFLNLAMIRRAAQESDLPFLNIVQACTWAPSMRVPGTNELRYLVSTTAAYGAKAISYYVYCCANHTGGIALADGTPTPLYHALKMYNREFAAITCELMPLKSLAVYHSTLREHGCEPLPSDAPFRLESTQNIGSPRGFLLGYFGKAHKPTHVIVVNLDYRADAATTLIASGKLQNFAPVSSKWTSLGSRRVVVRLAPGEGRLYRIK